MWGDFNFGSCHVVEGGGNKARPKEGERERERERERDRVQQCIEEYPSISS